MTDEIRPEGSEEPTEQEVKQQLEGTSAAQSATVYADPQTGTTTANTASSGSVTDLRASMGKAVQAKRAAGTSDRQTKGGGGGGSNGAGGGILDLDDVNRIKVKLGGVVWDAVEPTIEINKQLTQALPDITDENSAEAALQALNSIYPQVARVLRDPESDEPPTQEFVEGHLTGRNFGRLMERLNAEAQEGNPEAG